MMRRFHIRSRSHGANTCQMMKSFIIATRDGATPSDRVRQSLALAQAQRALDVSKSVIMTQLDHLIEPRSLLLALKMVRGDTVIAKATHVVRGFETFRRDDTTFTGGHRLHRMKAKNI